MATGEHATPSRAGAPDLRRGAVVTASGRVSAAVELAETHPYTPFSVVERARLDDALAMAGRETGLRFSIYLGDLGEDAHITVEKLHAWLGTAAPTSVLVAVCPDRRLVEVATGEEAAKRLPDRGAKLAVMTMIASFKDGDLVGGLLDGLRMLSDQTQREPSG